MRKTDKVVLRKDILRQSERQAEISCEKVVMDRVVLLHWIIWKDSLTVGIISNQYLAYLQKNYNSYTKLCVVFDSYNHDEYIKEHEHIIRKRKAVPSIKFVEDPVGNYQQEAFLSNKFTKQHGLLETRPNMSHF